MLQNSVGVINDEPDSGSEACVTSLDNGTEGGNSEGEEEYPEATIMPPIQPEVSLLVLCISRNVSCFQDHLLPQIQIFFKYTSTILMYLPCILQFILQTNLCTSYINNKYVYHSLRSFGTGNIPGCLKFIGPAFVTSYMSHSDSYIL